MKVCVVSPKDSHSAYKIAANAFCDLALKTAGTEILKVSDSDFLNNAVDSDLVVLIGSDAANSVTANLYLTGKTDGFGIKYCTDDYCIRTLEADGRKYLIFAGGRGRSTIYSVYRYFEKYLGCRYFWDGDRIKKCNLITDNINLTESPRFEYRGLRYFAHRSLHRFQAEHWSFEDWKTEINWMLKKRLNLFMLRIGMDDIFQKAFPDTVSYPERDEPLPEATDGYNDRSLFWSLQYRGELRKKILDYAFECDLMHPEDCGTMTHWYSRTPYEFLDKKKPEFLPQATHSYSEPTGLVWDVRKNENLNNYFKLTDTHVKEYGSSQIFHTIGLGERKYSADAEENRRMKLYVYRRIASYIKEKYPNSPLLIASWDLWMRFTPEEVRQLVNELDPNQSIIFDYTSDTCKENNFTKWGIKDKFPWIFGIFSGYESESEIRGFYELTNERIKMAKEDTACKGVVLWPELSHGDPLVTEYLSINAWENETPDIKDFIEKYCADRYSSEKAEVMTALWKDFMPIVSLAHWSMDDSTAHGGTSIFTKLIPYAEFKAEQINGNKMRLGDRPKYTRLAADVLNRLADITPDDAQIERDMFDIARTVIGRYLDAAIRKAQILYFEKSDYMFCLMDFAVSLMENMADLMSLHNDFSMYDTLLKVQSVTETNPNFEKTLKNNAECTYCRSFIYENARYLYLPEMNALFDEVKKSFKDGTEIDREAIKEKFASIKDNYFNVSLKTMNESKKQVSFKEICKTASEILKKMIV